MTTLSGPIREAQSGAAQSLVIFVHGYGADGADLIGIGDVLAEHMPNTMFMAPNAPQRSVMNPMGYQWFPIPRMDGSSEEAMLQGFAEAQVALDGFLDEVAVETGIPAAQTVLFGFSQGTMMSLHVGPRRAEALAGIVGFSGRLVAPELIGEIKTKPPVLLVHGAMDEVVPPSSTPEAAEALRAAGFQVATHSSPGVGHGIAPDGLGLALRFMQDRLG